MMLTPRSPRSFACWIAAIAFAVLPLKLAGQNCQTSAELDEATKTAITTTAQRYFDMAAKGDSASLKQNAIPSLASDFAGIEAVMKERQPLLTGAQSTVSKSFLLDASGDAPLPQAQFYCGVFGKNGQTANSAAFNFDNLPPAKYSVVLIDSTSAKGKTMFSEILQQMGNDWKLAGLYMKPAQVVGHESDWFLTRAREFKAKGQLHNAWLYYMQCTDLTSRGMDFMSTLTTDNLYDESHSVAPSDLPVAGKKVDLLAGSTTYTLTAVYVWEVGSDLDVFVKYRVQDVSNSNQTYQDNIAVMKALVTKFPEFRDAFSGVNAIAIDGQGRDYGTLLAMKDIK